MNNLNDVYQLHCKGRPLQKAKRDVFVHGDIDDVRRQFQVRIVNRVATAQGNREFDSFSSQVKTQGILLQQKF